MSTIVLEQMEEPEEPEEPPEEEDPPTEDKEPELLLSPPKPEKAPAEDKMPPLSPAPVVDKGSDGVYWHTKEPWRRRWFFGGRPRGRGPEPSSKRRLLPPRLALLPAEWTELRWMTRSPVISATMCPSGPAVIPSRSACASARGW